MARQDGDRRGVPRARPAETVPDKLCFRIGEVARICAVPSYVLRFWEREFPQLRPAKGGTGQRMYRRRDVEMALRVRRLLYEEGYTIPGARQWLREGVRSAGTADAVDGPAAWGLGVAGDVSMAGDARLREMRAELEQIARLLAGRQRRRTVEARQQAHRPGRRGGDGKEGGSLLLFGELRTGGDEERGR